MAKRRDVLAALGMGAAGGAGAYALLDGDTADATQQTGSSGVDDMTPNSNSYDTTTSYETAGEQQTTEELRTTEEAETPTEEYTAQETTAVDSDQPLPYEELPEALAKSIEGLSTYNHLEDYIDAMNGEMEREHGYAEAVIAHPTGQQPMKLYAQPDATTVGDRYRAELPLETNPYGPYGDIKVVDAEVAREELSSAFGELIWFMLSCYPEAASGIHDCMTGLGQWTEPVRNDRQAAIDEMIYSVSDSAGGRATVSLEGQSLRFAVGAAKTSDQKDDLRDLVQQRMIIE